MDDIVQWSEKSWWKWSARWKTENDTGAEFMKSLTIVYRAQQVDISHYKPSVCVTYTHNLTPLKRND